MSRQVWDSSGTPHGLARVYQVWKVARSGAVPFAPARPTGSQPAAAEP